MLLLLQSSCSESNSDGFHLIDCLICVWLFFLVVFQEKVEEDRYMRELELKYVETKKAEMQAQMAADEEKEFAEQVAPVMAEVQVLLGKSDESISQGALEALARWKLGL